MTSVVFPTSPTVGQSFYVNGVRFYWDGTTWSRAVGTPYLGSRLTNQFTATAGETTFTTSLNLQNIEVFVNGIKLSETGDYTVSGNILTLTTGLSAGDNLEVISYGSYDVLRDVYSESTVAPTNPPSGYIWYDTSNNQVNVYNGSTFVAVTNPGLGGTYDVTSTSAEVFDEFDLTLYRSADYQISYEDGTNSLYGSTKIFVQHNDTTAVQNQYVTIGDNYGTFTVAISGNYVQLSIATNSGVKMAFNKILTPRRI